jgi:predicted transposase/invertase (TIGR01784 family)
MSRYLNPYTDFGFKKLFGEEGSKDVLMDFLNTLLPAVHQIASLTLQNPDRAADLPLERRAIFDIHCHTAQGDRFVVEMQKARIRYFKDRALFYSTFPIREQGKRGEWDFALSPVYFVAVLDFFYDEEEEHAKLKREVQLMDQDCEQFYDKLTFIFIQMPAFKKTEAELVTHYDKWLYFLKHLPDFDQIPQILNEPVFQKAFHLTELSNLPPEERDVYDKNLIDYWSSVAAVETSYQEGLEKGRKEGRKEGREEGREEGKEEGMGIGYGQAAEDIASNLIVQTDMDDSQIAQLSGLPIPLVVALRRKIEASK